MLIIHFERRFLMEGQNLPGILQQSFASQHWHLQQNCFKIKVIGYLSFLGCSDCRSQWFTLRLLNICRIFRQSKTRGSFDTLYEQSELEQESVVNTEPLSEGLQEGASLWHYKNWQNAIYL